MFCFRFAAYGATNLPVLSFGGSNIWKTRFLSADTFGDLPAIPSGLTVPGEDLAPPFLAGPVFSLFLLYEPALNRGRPCYSQANTFSPPLCSAGLALFA